MILKTKKDKDVVTIELLSLNRTRNEKIRKTKISMDNQWPQDDEHAYSETQR